MQNNFSEQQWLLYMDGGLEPDAATLMQKHIDGCSDCRTFVASMLDVSRMLHQHGAGLRDAAAPSDAELDRMLARCLTRMRSDFPKRAGTNWTANEAVLLLRALVEPICGPGTAGASILLAVRRSTSDLNQGLNTGLNQGDERLTERNWNLFVSNLSDVMVSVCGSAAGRLVNRAGLCLALREG